MQKKGGKIVNERGETREDEDTDTQPSPSSDKKKEENKKTVPSVVSSLGLV